MFLLSILYKYFKQGFSRVMIRPADHVRRLFNLAGPVGSGQEMFEISRDGSGLVGSFPNLAGRDGLS